MKAIKAIIIVTAIVAVGIASGLFPALADFLIDPASSVPSVDINP